MVVRVGEVTHEALPEAAPGGAPAVASPSSPAALQAQVIGSLARERSRLERLWAD